jgi:DNA-binding NarL/FixJ family response regulator
MAIRVAIVDDHRLVREGLSKVLSAAPGIEVVGEAGRGMDAVPLVVSCRPDVVLLDIALPDVDGLTAVEQVLAASPDTRVLMLSMHSESEYAAAAAERGAHGLVGKSASPAALINAIRTIASGGVLPVEGALSAREREVLALVAGGWTNDEIAARLRIRLKTVDGHCERLMRKLGIHTRAGLLAHGRRVGLAGPRDRDSD